MCQISRAPRKVSTSDANPDYYLRSRSQMDVFFFFYFVVVKWRLGAIQSICTRKPFRKSHDHAMFIYRFDLTGLTRTSKIYAAVCNGVCMCIDQLYECKPYPKNSPSFVRAPKNTFTLNHLRSQWRIYMPIAWSSSLWPYLCARASTL